MTQFIDLARLNPTLRVCRKAAGVIPGGEFTLRPVRRVVWYELDFIVANEGGAIFIDGERLDLSMGDVIIRKPGNLVTSLPRYSAYGVFFSVTHENKPERSDILDRLPMQFSADGSWLPCLALAKELYELQFSQDPVSMIRIKQCLFKLIGILYTHQFDREKGLTTGKGAPAERTLHELIGYIRGNPGADLSMKALSERSGYSVSYLRVLFHRYLGVSPVTYVTGVRMEWAQRLLAEEHCPISEISERCGLSNISHFYEAFRKHTGVTPGEFRACYREY